MTGKPNNSGRGELGTAYAERRSVERWSRAYGFRGEAEPRAGPLSESELRKAVEVIERSLVDGFRNGRQAEGLLSAYRDCLKKLGTL